MSFVAALAVALLGATTTVPEAQNDFHFVVLGDSQFNDPPAFNRMIDDVRTLRPAFAIQVGDMIVGYTDDQAAYRAEWARYKAQIAPLDPVTFVPVPGNHDLYGADRKSSADADALYRETWGPTYRTFTYANARFVVLNTDGVRAESRIDQKQWQWLERTLKQNKSKHVFAFMHRPPASLTNAEALHALFKAHGVGHVFYGHHHHYHFSERDGIRYIMTNASGSMATQFEAVGNVSHLLQVSVHDDEVSVAVIRADSFVPLRSVKPEDNYQLFGIVRQLAPDRVEAVSRGERLWVTNLTLRNPSNRNITVYMNCTSPDDRWQLSPVRIPALNIGPKSQQQIELEWSYNQKHVPEGTPSCELSVPFQTSAGTWVRHQHTVEVGGLP